MNEPRARSVIFDILGDCRRVGADEIRLKVLVQLGAMVGIAAENTRVLVARMREEGWFEVRREGRESIYSLTPKTHRVIEEGRQRIFRAEPSTWDGSWSLVIYSVPETDRPTRERLRRDLSWMGFGSLAPATWVSPFQLLDRVADLGATLPNAKLDLLTMRSSGLAADRSIVERCWELDALNEEYAAFIRTLRLRTMATRGSNGDKEEAFSQRIGLVHEYRRFPYRDPGLPPDLQPPGWLGDQARQLFIDAHEVLAEGAAQHYAELGVIPSTRRVTTARSPS